MAPGSLAEASIRFIPAGKLNCITFVNVFLVSFVI